MRLKFIGLLGFVVLCFNALSQEQSPSISWTYFDSLVEVHQPNKARTYLLAFLEAPSSQKDHHSVIKAYANIPKTLIALSFDERFDLFLKMDSISEQLNEPSRSITSHMLTLELMYNRNAWIPHNAVPKEVLVRGDTMTLNTEEGIANYCFDRFDHIKSVLPSLKNYGMGRYFSIIKLNDFDKALCPTVFDYLAHSLIKLTDHYLFTRYHIQKNAFNLPVEYASLPDHFAELKIDPESLEHERLQLYQALESFHFKQRSLLSKIHYQRLKMVSGSIENFNGEEIWKKSAAYYEGTSYASKFKYEHAHLKYMKGKNYHFKRNPDVEKELKEAHRIVVNELSHFPNSDFSEQLSSLKTVIEKPSLTLNIQNQAHPTDPIPIKLTYQNLNEVNLFIYELPDYYDKSKSPRELIANSDAKLERSKTISLELKEDFQQRTSSLLLDKIDKPGAYFMVITDSKKNLTELAKDPSKWTNATKSTSILTVTNISVAQQMDDSSLSLMVTDYKTGKPIEGAEVLIYYMRNYKDYSSIPSNRLKTNEKGWIRSKIPKGSVMYRIKYNGSELVSSHYSYNRNNDSRDRSRIEMFTDRGIYRPGQTVAVKFIAYDGQDNNFKVLPAQEIKVELKDASYQKVMDTVVKTNDFGSAHAKFHLPEVGPLGNFTISAHIQGKTSRTFSKSFSVEEYKRPTFETKIDAPLDEAKLDDSVKVILSADAFAGYPISNANVTYEVYRKWHRYWRYYYGGNEHSDLIIEGKATTNNEGELPISFFAALDPNAPDYAYYTFEVRAKVTDVSGETHEAILPLNLTKTGFLIQYEGAYDWSSEDSISGRFKVVNTSGKKQDGFNGKLVISKKKEQNTFLSRIWEDAQYQKFDSLHWSKLFPYANYSSFDREESVYEEIVTKEISINETIDFSTLLAGKQGVFKFEVEATNAKKDTIIWQNEFTYVDLEAKELPQKQALWTYLTSENAKVGDEVSFHLGSSIDSATAHVEIRAGDELLEEHWLDLSERKSIDFAIKEAHRGGIQFSVILIYDGKRYSDLLNVKVPRDDKKLTLKTVTFRDQLEPGQKETWKFSIEGNEGDRVAAEVLAGMYDASLDAFRANHWSFWPYGTNYFYAGWRGPEMRRVEHVNGSGDWQRRYKPLIDGEYQFQGYKLPYGYGYGYGYGERAFRTSAANMQARDLDEIEISEEAEGTESAYMLADSAAPSEDEESDIQVSSKKESLKDEKTLAPRTNFNETAFFQPQIGTNKSGDFEVEFTLPESLTKWKFMALAHTKDMKIGDISLTTVAQKKLMITANSPRFFRRGDQMDFSAKVINLTDEVQEVTADLTFFNPKNNKAIQLLSGGSSDQKLVLKPNASIDVSWPIDLSNQTGLISYKVMVANETFSDGEQKSVPVLDNRKMVLETLPFVVTEKRTTNFEFTSMKSNTSKTLTHERYVFEYTQNPAWNAVLALPYLAEYPYDCAEQVFSRFFANALAHKVVTSKPNIAKVFEKWRTESPEALQSELEKNQELKTILLEETPWVVNAKNEAEQRRNIAELFKLTKIAKEQDKALRELEQKQNGDGGFSWFGKGKSNLYITQHIVTGFGHLKRLGIDLPQHTERMLEKAIRYMDGQHVEIYQKYYKNKKNNYTISSIALHWLYASTFFTPTESEVVKEVKTYHHEKLQENWSRLSLYQQALAGIYFNRVEDEKHTDIIAASLRDRAKKEPNKGMYFPENERGYYWYNDPIGTHAIVTEFFIEVNAPNEEIDALRLWMIMQKRSNAWESTKSTAQAIYALLLNGSDYLSDQSMPDIKVGGETIVFEETNAKNKRYVSVTPGLGYLKTTWKPNEVSTNLADFNITKTTNTPSYGAVYWQYFEDFNKIKAASIEDLEITKSYRRVVAGAKGERYEDATDFKVGDRINIEMTITVRQEMEFVHIKDLRPAGFEPKKAMSGHQYNNGLRFYQSPRDVSMNYFIDRLPKGTYRLSYDVYAVNSGSFNAGNATIQCMYAPEFIAHSGGTRIKIEKE